ncbi:DUF4230 domain-containing protein [Hoylesella buccalis]|uniref:DUF4230 domain-containing protein n=1 Tax=Hoylesella buccalis DNF00853 TaxID=1401074 RepID=A0A096BNX0_9BACT|nr:DUF4230 domain-containing protein [Hoylesella buccalis]KGF34894.1 hypothetical protein HMPREF2137_05890 [Hoylesella buccalis DNF00853]
METKNNKIHNLLNCLSKISRKTIFSMIMVLLLVSIVLVYLNKDNRFELSKDDKIKITPTQIQSIRDIGQWEFLTINNEEIIDTVRHGFFGDAELVRIYYGTLRLGIDLQDAGEDFIEPKGDSIVVMLPPVKLLDHNFIDEARTKSFFEKGEWKAKDRDDLYRRAYQAMIDRCLTTPNIQSAERNATRQFYKLMKSMGFENVIIRTKPYAIEKRSQ